MVNEERGAVASDLGHRRHVRIDRAASLVEPISVAQGRILTLDTGGRSRRCRLVAWIVPHKVACHLLSFFDVPRSLRAQLVLSRVGALLLTASAHRLPPWGSMPHCNDA